MIRTSVMVRLLLCCSSMVAVLAQAAPSRPALSAGDIISKNVVARGGLEAWRAVQVLSLQGTLGSGGNQRAQLPQPVPGRSTQVLPTDPRPKEEVELPFLMEMARPLKVRFELQFRGQTALQVFDGTSGWKVRPYLNRQEVEPFTPEEMKKAAAQSELDGPLLDWQAKGSTVALDGTERVDDRDTYKLAVTLKNGQVIHVWVDAQTFLETKVEGQPRRLDGVDHPVEVYYKDYRSVSGLKIPFVMETQVLPIKNPGDRSRQVPVPSERIHIEKVTINPKLSASAFSKPEQTVARATLPR